MKVKIIVTAVLLLISGVLAGQTQKLVKKIISVRAFV